MTPFWRSTLIVGTLAIALAAGAFDWWVLPEFKKRIAAATSASPPPAAREVSGWEKVSPNARAQLRTYVGVQLVRLFDGQFDELEKEAASPSFPALGIIGGSPGGAFYGSFAYSDWNDQPEWERFFSQLDRWAAAHPDSPHHGIARAKALISHAWEARGGGYANTVTEEGWRLFGERLRAAVEALKQCEARGGAAYPVFWEARFTIARGLNLPPRETLQLAETAIERFPDALNLYVESCIYLLPRWHGAPGQWEGWLKRQADHPRWGADGMPPMLYARIVWRVYRYLHDEPVFKHASLSWPKTLAGLDQLCAEYPKSDYWKTTRARLAACAEDRNAFSSALRAMNGRFDTSAFDSKSFKAALDWGREPVEAQP